MTPFVVLAVANCGEALGAELAMVRFLTSMGSHVHKKVAFLSKDLSTVRELAFEQILS